LTDVRSFTDLPDRTMNFRPNAMKPAGPNALAQEADFDLGSLRVPPSRLETNLGDRRETIQPGVMQVLVTLERDSSGLNRAGDSQKAASQIQDAGWREASMDGQALF
jgi:hypothetical protein